jgi:hypothetical protein
MATRAVQMFSGVDSVRAANELQRAIQARRDAWPYPHVYPPPDSLDVFVISTVAVPVAPAALTIVALTYQVQSGKKFFQAGVIFGFQGGSFTPGDATFTEDRNSALNSANNQFLPEHGLVNVPVLLGGQINGSYVEPFLFRRAREFEPLDVIRIKPTNVNLTGGTFVAGIFGWEVPVLSVKRGRR